MEGEPMMSFGGRRFYIKGVLFLETVDMISWWYLETNKNG
jgi:hypothetical protein